MSSTFFFSNIDLAAPSAPPQTQPHSRIATARNSTITSLPPLTTLRAVPRRALSAIMAATATATSSLPTTRAGSPHLANLDPTRHATPPPPASKPIPADFRSSLSAWWNNASYKEARHAEERLLRRMEMFRPAPVTEAPKGWFGWTSAPAASTATTTAGAADQPAPDLVSAPTTTGGLVATLRNVFIPTPVPERAPLHPADPYEPIAASPRSSISEKSKRCKKDDKLVDYINTLEISSAANKDSKEAVVVLHGYAAAMG